MKARNLLENSIYDPEKLEVVFTAFDAAWAEISHHFEGDTEQARLRLAHAVLIVTNDDSADPQHVKRDALQVMALAYRRRV
jgi:hypothetical protein